MKATRKYLIITQVVLLSMFMLCISCQRNVSRKLRDIDQVISLDNVRGERLLDSVRYHFESMSKGDQMYYKLLRLKLDDKAYRPITQKKKLVDSLVGYFDGGYDQDIQAESYYMAGRVYYELGDSPSSLAFYQKAENVVARDNYALQGDILSQMAYIYQRCGLYKNAISVLKKAYLADSLNANKENMLFDLRDIGVNYYGWENIPMAEAYYSKGLSIAKNMKNMKMVNTFSYLLAVIYIERKQYEKAQLYLCQGLKNLDGYDSNKSGVYSAASMLYHLSKQDDKAEKYDAWLLKNGTIWGKNYALKNKIESAIVNKNIDKIHDYWPIYNQQIDSISKISHVVSVKKIEQLYNYEVTEKENIELHRKNTLLIILISGTVFLLCMSVCIIVLASLNYTQKQKNLKLKLDKYKNLKDKLDKRNLLEYKQNETRIVNSKIFEKIQQAINIGDFKLEDSQWEELEKIVTQVYPNFIIDLNSFVEVSKQELRVCLMIKIGISPVNIARFTNHSKEAINSTRGRLYKKAFHQSASAPKWDEFIKTL